MSISALVETLLAAGVDHATVVAAVKSVENQVDDRLARKREADRIRIAEKREVSRMSRDNATNATSATPDKEKSPHTPLKEINPDTSLRSVSGASAPKPAKRNSRIAPDFTPNETGMSKAAEAGMSSDDLRRELARFIDFHTAKGSTMADWQAAWRTWCGSFKTFAKPRAGPSQQAPARRGSAAIFDALDRIFPDAPPDSETIPSGPVFQLADQRQR